MPGHSATSCLVQVADLCLCAGICCRRACLFYCREIGSEWFRRGLLGKGRNGGRFEACGGDSGGTVLFIISEEGEGGADCGRWFVIKSRMRAVVALVIVLVLPLFEGVGSKLSEGN